MSRLRTVPWGKARRVREGRPGALMIPGGTAAQTRGCRCKLESLTSDGWAVVSLSTDCPLVLVNNLHRAPEDA